LLEQIKSITLVHVPLQLCCGDSLRNFSSDIGQGGWLYLANIRSAYWTVAANQVKGKRGFYQKQLKHAAMTPLRSTSHVETLPANLKDNKNSA